LAKAVTSSNLFVATQARWVQVRLLIRQERFEAALTAVQTLQAKHLEQAVQPDEWQLMHGLLLAYLLEREPATTALNAYLAKFPQAPAGRRQLAQRVLAGL